MLRLFRRLGVLGFVFLILACSGGGCSGCTSCGVTPLAGGFPKASAITNSGAVRVSRHGLDFMQANLGTIAGKALGGGATINYPIGHTSFSLGIATIDICSSPGPGQCIVQIELSKANLTLTAVHPDSLTIAGTVPVEATDIPMTGIFGCTMHAGLGAGAGCNGATPTFTGFANVPVTITLPLIAETIAPRDGYTKVDTANAVVNMNLDSSMFTVCSSGLCVVLSSIIDAFKSSLIGYLTSPLQSQIKNALDSALCTKTNTMLTPSCPTGSHDNGGTCYYDSSPSTCLPTLLGMDGHINLGKFFANISPGTAGGLDFVLASGGNAIDSTSINMGTLVNTPDSTNGITLGLMGGGLPNPQSGCIPPFNNVIPTGIPIPDEMQNNTQSPWPTGDNGPDLGIALAGRYLNFMFGSVYNSGALCLGISTDQFSQLQSGLLSVLIPSIKRLTFEQTKAPVAIATRPQNPPVAKIGTGSDINSDPLLSILLKQFAIDFYVWSDDRYVRAMTFTGDLTIPVNLSTHVDPKTNPSGGILPALGNVSVANATVTNSELLVDDPASIASGLGALFGAITMQLGGSLKPISLSSSLATYGLSMTIPDGGIRKLSKGTDDYLAIFADLATCTSCDIIHADVQAQITGKTVVPEAMTLATADRTKEPKLNVLFGSSLDDGTRAVEYSWAIDQGLPSEWSSSRNSTIQSDQLFLQGKHVLNVWARIHGQEETQSTDPAQVPFIIDVIAPYITLSEAQGGGVHVSAWDIVSDVSALKMRYKTTDALGHDSPWTAWGSVADVPAKVLGSLTATIEVEDEEGNIGSQSSALIRGRSDPSLATGSGCSSCTVGRSPGAASWVYALPSLLGLGVLALRRRKTARREVSATSPSRSSRSPFKLVLGIGAVIVAAIFPGCNCGTSNGGMNCGSDCKQQCDPTLVQGLIGEYTSLAVAKDGTIWVAGYNDSDGNKTLYGDLVVGKWDPAKSAVQWTDVDGVPSLAPGCGEADPQGWRGGVEDPGDDVGLWTSMVLDPSTQNPMVVYYDATHNQAKFATYNGTSWNIYALSQGLMGTDQGRYAKMILVNNNPVVAYLGMEAGMGGYVRSRVIVARAKASPPAATDWTYEDAAVNQQDPCQPQYCTQSQVCLTTAAGVTGICTATVNGCNPACASGTGCVAVNMMPTCVATLDPTGTTPTYVPSYPNVYGDYISLANGPNGLGIALYDRFHGNLWGLTNAGGKWTPTLLDGQTGMGTMISDTGDDGIAANLVIAQNGDWNIAYVNGVTEHLQLLVWPGGKGTPLNPELIDDGYNNGMPYPDGQHIVGDDVNINIDGSGNVTAVYQDSTVGALRVATGVPSTGGTHKWTAKTVPQQGKFAGFFPKFASNTQVANWFRAGDPTMQTEWGDVTMVTP